MFTVRKEFKFDAAHRLVKGYPGKCQHLHGHEWTVRVELETHRLNEFDMSVDFGDLSWLKGWIDEHWDHATLVAGEDTELLQWLKANNQRHYAFFSNPTSEALASFIFGLVEKSGLPVKAVEIDETCTSTARYEP